jgi:hypothetical protein
VAKGQMREFLIHASKLFFFDLVLPLNNTWNLEVRMVFRYPAILPALSVFKSQGRESGLSPLSLFPDIGL